MLFKKMKFEKRITIHFTLLMVFIIFLLNIVMLISMRIQFFYLQSKSLSYTVAQVERGIQDTLDAHRTTPPHFSAQMEQLRNENIFVKITSEKTVLFDNTPSLSHIAKFALYHHPRFKEALFLVQKEITVNGTNFQLLLIRDNSNELKIFRTVMLLLGIISIIGTILIYIFSRIISRAILKPINDIISTAKQISMNEITTRLPVSPTEDELQQLGIVLNAMLDRLQDSFESQNRFVEDASHELRTPLQILRGYTELLAGWGKNDPIVSAEAVTSIKEEVYNMISLVERLLLLAKRDSNSLSVNLQQVQMNEFMEKFLKDMSLISNGRNLVLVTNESYSANIDAKLILQSLRAILDNSIKYSNENSTIEVSSKFSNKRAVIEIKDSGIGIEKNDLDKLFARFYRSDASRTKDTGGAGLGLAIVKAIITLHGGSVEISSQINKGTTVTINIPV